MTAGGDKDVSNTLCLICDASMSVSTRKCCPIFETRVNTSDRTIVSVISYVLGVHLTAEDVHSNVVCKKCYKVCNEVDELEERLAELKLALSSNYQKTMRRQSETKTLSSDIISERTYQKSNSPPPPPVKRKRGRPPKNPVKELISTDVDTHIIELIPEETGLLHRTKNYEEDAGDGDGQDNGDEDNDENIESEIIEVGADDVELDGENITSEYVEDINIKIEDDEQDLVEEEEEEDDDEEEETLSSEHLLKLEPSSLRKALTLRKLPLNMSQYPRLSGPSLPPQSLPLTPPHPLTLPPSSPLSAEETDLSIKKNKKPKAYEILIPKVVVHREGQLYTCLVCNIDNKYTADARGIITHLKERHEIRLYICDVCGIEFVKRRELYKHLDEHVNEDDRYECAVCYRVFNNFRLYRIHKKMHVTQSKNYTCELCGKRYGSRNLLEEHNNMHTGERPFSCSTCGKNFTSKYTLKSHERTHEERPRPFMCINCGKSFLTQQNLIHHERIHSGIKNYICQECGKPFNTARNLEAHFIIHTGFKPYICRLCGKAFTRKSDIRDHERTHTGEKPYTCEFCGAAFSQRSNLQTHKRSTHYDDKRYKCTDCGRAFKRRRLLDYHMKASHTGERPYKCTVCEATFIYPEHFKKHKLIHTGAKPFECEVCGKAFNSRDNRNAHRFVHSDKKPYECLVCGIGFMRKPLLYNHMQTAGHQNDTIVVNQPRLTTTADEENLNHQESSAVSIDQEQLEMTIHTHIEDNENENHQDKNAQQTAKERELFIEDMKEHIVIQDHHGTNQQNLHIVDDKINLDKKFNVDVAHTSDASSNIQHVIIPDTACTLRITEEQNGDPLQTQTYQESTAAKTNDGTIQIVQISLAQDNTEQKQWFNLIQAQPT